jgi:drug/metabolite transporter (DMT)-like permease
MTVAVALGLAVALASAIASNLGFLWRHRGANDAQAVDIGHPLRSAVDLFRQKWWTIGYLTALVAWLLHVGALALAPLSLVQALLAGGLVFLAVLADRMFGFRVGRREWIGIGLVAVGLAFIALTAGQATESAKSEFELYAMIAFEGSLAGLGLIFILSQRGDRDANLRGVMLGAAAGVLFALSHVAIKGIAGAVEVGTGPNVEVLLDEPAGLMGPLGALLIGSAVAAFYASARSLQLGDALPVIAVTSAAGNSLSILGGVLVFGDPIGSNPAEIVARVLAFLLVIGAAALIPAPLRAAGRRGPRQPFRAATRGLGRPVS